MNSWRAWMRHLPMAATVERIIDDAGLFLIAAVADGEAGPRGRACVACRLPVRHDSCKRHVQRCPAQHAAAAHTMVQHVDEFFRPIYITKISSAL